jgi:hypothetical protein
MSLSRFFKTLLASASLAALASSPLFATDYVISGGSVSANPAHPDNAGLEINTQVNGGIAGLGFALNDGDSITFPFFDIWTPEGSIQGDDLASVPITATLNFSLPSIGADLSGVTFGGSVIIFQWGKVEWGAPVTVTTGDREFEVSLSDEVFNFGFFGLGKQGATVSATVRQVSSRVPDGGSTLLMLGGAFSLAAIVLRSRTRFPSRR